MVAGHLREKKGYYYAVLNYTDSLGKRKTKWISTGLTVKGNKKRAEAILMDARRNFNPEEPKVMNGDILFADYMEQWLDIIKSSVAVPTFASYSTTVKRVVAPYFREKEITLKNLTAKDIQEFYMKELQRVSASSVIHYHANIHKALKYAVKIDLIDVNPADKVERPKKDRYVGSFYDADEVNALFEAAKGTKLELPILFGAFYGLRRSEAIGLKWDAIDFEQNTITIRHTVTSCDLDGKRVLVASDTTKTKSSMRTLPLVPFMRERLLTLKEEQQENRRLCGRSYIKEYLEYMEKWLDIIKSSVAVPTFASYSTTVKKIVAPYFREKEVTLKNLTAKDIQEFYLSELERVSPSSVIHYHANIHKALKYAVKIDLIDVNPADKVERPKKDRYVGSFYDADEVNALFEAAKGTKLELPILFGAFYGLRRSEAIGLKWDAIDFEQNTITIRHTVTSCDLDGKRVLVASDTTKTKSSMRTLPLVPFMRERLLALKEEQQENRRLCGRSYIKDYIGYVCVNEIGDLIKPHYVTESFPKLLKANGLRHIRYHDLRHSCASLLLANGVPMKQIQEWLGHSDFSTTANIYAHLDYSSKLTSADAMLNGLGLAPN